ncbi:unnamed protein product, partial [Sphacelaria rigidula]
MVQADDQVGCLASAVSADANISTEINYRISAVWGRVRKYSSQRYDRPNAQLPLKIQVRKAEMVEVMLYRCATWALRSEDFCQCELPTTSVCCEWLDSRSKERTGYWTLPCRGVLEMTIYPSIETTVRERQLGFVG